MIGLIDSHAHLDFDAFESDMEQLLARARQAGVEAVITVGTDHDSSAAAALLARTWPMLFAAAGFHPHDAATFEDRHWPLLEQLWRHERVVAVGETGLDYHYNHSPPATQRDVFARQLTACAEVALPVVIHVREAYDDAFSLIADHDLPAGGVLHCFTGGPRECERALELGLHVSLSGIVTFPKAAELREAVPRIPDHRVLVETDCPFLAPVPRRGKRNEPAYVRHTAEQVAQLRGQSLDELARLTRANTVELFRLPL